ncbi:retrovirus-related Pol polyprotein from type-2 retrotransposable element R2DM [Trichonephila clavipes]|nr:retrovirus-related Pol polyprotein from type-2 retrotransposable element R2DM [Trichonephila clavipes]
MPWAIPDDFPFPTYPEPVADDFLTAPFVASEVWDKLSHLSDSAPGPDGIRYSVLKNRDPGAHLLTAVFNRVQQSASVPQAWKNSRKGFRENEGCVEHNFLLEQAIVEAKRSRSDLALAWLDLENAFGSIPHAFIFGSLKAVGVPASVINIITSLYLNAKSEIRCGPDWSPPIPMKAGVRQGCPLSAILFNLSLEQILRPALEVDSEGYSLFGKSLRCLAYADDLVILDKSKSSLQLLLDSLCSISSSIGLRFNPPKCASLAFFHSKGRRSVDPGDLKILNTPIPSLSGLEAYKYLGMKVGLNFHHDYASLFDSACNDILKVKNSLLAPWQKLHAIRSIILPRLDFACRNAHVRKSQVERLDKLIISAAKSIMNLPSRANTTLGHLAMLDVHTIGHAFHSLSSPDATVADVARAGLVSVVRKRTRANPDLFVLAEYLNGSSSGRFAGGSSDFSTIWSRARHAAQRLNKKFNLEWAASDATDSLVLFVHRRPNPVAVAPSAANLVVRILRDELETFYISRLASLPDQGKTIGAVSLHPASNHFIQGGHYTRFCDWNFIHRARLGVLQLNATKRFGRGNPRCRKCGYARETIPHVLNHCKVHSTAWRRRHDAIQTRVSKAIPSHLGTITINKKFPGISSTLIPDLVLRKHDGETIIVDFTVAFEDRYDSLVAARNAKTIKIPAHS